MINRGLVSAPDFTGVVTGTPEPDFGSSGVTRSMITLNLTRAEVRGQTENLPTSLILPDFGVRRHPIFLRCFAVKRHLHVGDFLLIDSFICVFYQFGQFLHLS